MLLFWPWAEAPFSEPKRWVLGLAAVVSAALLAALLARGPRRSSAVEGATRPVSPLGRRDPWRWAPAALLPAIQQARADRLFAWRWAPVALAAATLASALAGPSALRAASFDAVAFSLLAACWFATGVGPRALQATSLAGALAATVAVLQAFGFDPFASFGPGVTGERLRVYSTLGNPDFVASAITATLALTFAAWKGRAALLLALPQVAALAATRSFATLGAVAVGAAVVAARVKIPRVLVAALAVLAVLGAGVAGRSVAGRLAGRWYLVRVAAPHLADAPFLGLGPGAVEREWPLWELDFWKQRCGNSRACVEAHPDRRFAEAQEHVHCDWLERAVTTGWLGLAALGWVFAAAARASRRNPGLPGAAVSAGLGAFAARAVFDFPLARPADLCVLALLLAASSPPSTGAAP